LNNGPFEIQDRENASTKTQSFQLKKMRRRKYIQINEKCIDKNESRVKKLLWTSTVLMVHTNITWYSRLCTYYEYLVPPGKTTTKDTTPFVNSLISKQHLSTHKKIITTTTTTYCTEVIKLSYSLLSLRFEGSFFQTIINTIADLKRGK
jgi:hypothetical protein